MINSWVAILECTQKWTLSLMVVTEIDHWSISHCHLLFQYHRVHYMYILKLLIYYVAKVLILEGSELPLGRMTSVQFYAW